MLLNDSPNFDNDLKSNKSEEIPSSSSRFQWPSQKNQSISSSTFYNKTDCDTSSRIEKSLQKSLHSPSESDLYRKSRSTLMDTADREYFGRELAKINSTPTVGASSLLCALDEDYGVRSVGQSVDEKVKTTSPNDRLVCNVDIFAGTEVGDCERKIESPDKLVEMEQCNEDSEDIIPCTPPPPGKSLKRKSGIIKKQKKITDMYPKLNINQ